MAEELNTAIMKELGLTDAEIKVYCLLAKKGQMSASIIAKETDLNRSHLYRIIERLIKQKLISEVISGKIKCFSASNPSIFKEILNNKISRLKEKSIETDNLIEGLKAIKPEESPIDFNVQVYSGKEELKDVLKNILNLKKGETTYAFGSKGIFKHLFDEFWEDYKTKRANKGIIFKGVLNVASIEKIDPKRPHNKLTYVRFANLKSMTNVRVDFYRDNVIIFFTDPKNPKAILIKNKEIARAMKTYFDFLWENAESYKEKLDEI
jgi:sugar-specific transcriptional regulator TrmB